MIGNQIDSRRPDFVHLLTITFFSGVRKGESIGLPHSLYLEKSVGKTMATGQSTIIQTERDKLPVTDGECVGLQHSLYEEKSAGQTMVTGRSTNIHTEREELPSTDDSADQNNVVTKNRAKFPLIVCSEAVTDSLIVTVDTRATMVTRIVGAPVCTALVHTLHHRHGNRDQLAV
ncbi:hypothetical protein MAR_038036 [Mya arenaria]|uniref:Uncharacterized protein n=1 Tax=Mya arenaria TaxID=6604 RepID=A0ABY7FQF0_MYAAR|nr:hypothetical protein MAR_038036 [Mya arenaria]